jgi:large subunit ribosomal protein L25
MGNKLYVTQVLHQTSKSCNNTVICQVKISRAAMKAAQEAAKAAKAPVKERKIIFFQSYLKHQL